MERARVEAILKRALGFSRANEFEAYIGGGNYSLTRFANSVIHQNVNEKRHMLSARSVFGKKTGRAVTNKFGDEDLASTVRTSEVIAKAQPDIPELLPVAEPQSYQQVNAFDADTAAFSPAARADAVSKAVELCRKNGLQAAGYFSTGSGSLGSYGEIGPLGMANSRKLFAYHLGTDASFSITAMSGDSSGWAQASSWKVSDINAEELASIAIEKAKRSANPRSLEPGKYTVVLEPAAVAELLGYMAWVGFGALQVQEGRSFMSGKIGQRLFGQTVSIYDDVYQDLLRGRPFDYEGMPVRKVPVIEDGVIKGPIYDRATAAKESRQSTGHGLPVPNTQGPQPASIVMSARGAVSLPDLVGGADRCILVTRFWYVNIVDPMKMILTGMTRDGTFLVEKGKISTGIRNFRFNQNIIELLNNVRAMSVPVRSGGCVVPGILATDFNFSSGTEF